MLLDGRFIVKCIHVRLQVATLQKTIPKSLILKESFSSALPLGRGVDKDGVVAVKEAVEKVVEPRDVSIGRVAHEAVAVAVKITVVKRVPRAL